MLIECKQHIHFKQVNQVILRKKENRIFQPIWKFSMFSGRSQIDLFVLFFSKVLVYGFISSSLLWDLRPSVAKKSHSIKLSLSLPVSDYNGLLIFNYPMPTPCLAKDQKKKPPPPAKHTLDCWQVYLCWSFCTITSQKKPGWASWMPEGL